MNGNISPSLLEQFGFDPVALAQRSIAKGWMKLPEPSSPLDLKQIRREKHAARERAIRAEFVKAGLQTKGKPRKRNYQFRPEYAGLSKRVRDKVYLRDWRKARRAAAWGNFNGGDGI